MSSLPPPPPPPPPPGAGDGAPVGPARYTAPPPPPGPPRPADRSGRLVFVLGLLVTLALVGGLVAAWPEDEGPAAVDTETSTTLMSAEAAAQLGRPDVGGSVTPEIPAVTPTQLFVVGPDTAVQDVLAAAGGPSQLLELAIHPTYLFVAYRDPADPDRIPRRMWRDGRVHDAEPNPIDDEVDASTTPQLFGLDELDLALGLIPSLVQDAPTHYDEPVQVTHVLIDRFLPFDQRVLVRVYASPPGDPTGGGYVTYTTAGVFQKVCC